MKKTCKFLVLLLFSLCLISFGKTAYAAESKEYDQTTTDYWETEDDYVTVTFSLNYPTYTGKARKPSILVQTEDGKLKKKRDYKVSYKHSKNVGVDTATATVTGLGDYKGNKTTISFSIRPAKVKGLKKVKSTAPLSNKLTWKKVKGADGYAVYRSTKKTSGFKLIAELTGNSYTTYLDTDLSLKNGKTYYYQVYSYASESDDSDEYDWYWLYSDNVYSKKSSTIKITASNKTKEKYYPIYTGDADLDYAAELICKKIIKKSMSADEKVKAIYKWICKNFEHIKNMNTSAVSSKYKIVYNFDKNAKKAAAYEKTIMKKVYKGKAYLTSQTEQNDRARIALAYHKGSCSYINRVFRLLCNHVGVSCGIAGGPEGYTNSDGESMIHYFCYARTNGKYYWYDADIGTTVFRKHNSVTYAYYKQTSKVWKKNYTWKGEGYYEVPKKIQ